MRVQFYIVVCLRFFSLAMQVYDASIYNLYDHRKEVARMRSNALDKQVPFNDRLEHSIVAVSSYRESALLDEQEKGGLE